MFLIEVSNGGHSVECEFCGRKEFIDGPFVRGLQTPASVQHALRWHHRPNVLFTHETCPAADSWSAASWEVSERRTVVVVARGEFQMQEGQPVVDPSIDGKVNGLDWDARRVKTLAEEVIAASSMPNRKWIIVAEQHPTVVLVSKDGKRSEVVISREDIHVGKISDDDIRAKIRAKLTALEIFERNT